MIDGAQRRLIHPIDAAAIGCQYVADRLEVLLPLQPRLKLNQPTTRLATPRTATDLRLIWPDGMGRSGRYSRSNWASKASLMNMPPV